MSNRLNRLAPLSGVLFAASLGSYLCRTPAAEGAVVIVLVIWSIVVGILMYRRMCAPVGTRAASPQPGLTPSGTTV